MYICLIGTSTPSPALWSHGNIGVDCWVTLLVVARNPLQTNTGKYRAGESGGQH